MKERDFSRWSGSGRECGRLFEEFMMGDSGGHLLQLRASCRSGGISSGLIDLLVSRRHLHEQSTVVYFEIGVVYVKK